MSRCLELFADFNYLVVSSNSIRASLFGKFISLGTLYARYSVKLWLNTINKGMGFVDHYSHWHFARYCRHKVCLDADLDLLRRSGFWRRCYAAHESGLCDVWLFDQGWVLQRTYLRLLVQGYCNMVYQGTCG